MSTLYLPSKGLTEMLMGFKPDQDALFPEIMIPFICLMALVFDCWLIDTHLAPPCGPLHGPMDLLLRGLHHLIKCHLVLPRCRQYVQSSTPNPMPFQQHYPPVQNQASSQQQNPYSSPSQVDHSTWQSPQHCPPTLYDHHQQHLLTIRRHLQRHCAVFRLLLLITLPSHLPAASVLYLTPIPLRSFRSLSSSFISSSCSNGSSSNSHQ